MHLHVLNIMVIMKITLFLLVVKNPSARKALKSSHCSKKKMREFSLRDCSTSHRFSFFSESLSTNQQPEFSRLDQPEARHRPHVSRPW